MPVGDVLVGNAGGDVEHDNAALAVDVVAVAQTTELLLASGIPDVELDLTVVLCASCQRGVCFAESEELTVVKPRGWTSTPSVAMYFFSNSPVKWRLTKVVCDDSIRVSHGSYAIDVVEGREHRGHHRDCPAKRASRRMQT